MHIKPFSKYRSLIVKLIVALMFVQLSPAGDYQMFVSSPEEVRALAESLRTPGDHWFEVLRSHQLLTLLDDGTTRHVSELSYEILNEDACEVLGDVQTEWSPWYAGRPRIRARVIEPDGTVHQLDPEHLIESSGTEAGYLQYSERRRITAPLPGIRVGSIVEIQIVERDVRPYYAPGNFWSIDFFIDTPVPQHLIVEVPERMPFAHEDTGFGEGPEITEHDGVKRYTWTLPNGSNKEDEALVSFATGGSWQKLATSYAEIWEETLTEMDFAAAIADLDIPDDPREAAAFLINHVNRKVRYTGLYLGDGAVIPTDPETVWQRGFGDCKDKAVLVTGMLRAHGIEVYPALVSTAMDIDPDLPGMGAFNHVIIYLPGDIWLDPTQEYSRDGTLPAGLGGGSALLVRPETTDLIEIPVSRPEDHEETTTLVYDMRDGDSGDISYHWTGKGLPETIQRRNNQGLDVDKRIEILAEALEADAIEGFTYTPSDDYSVPWSESYRAVRSGFQYGDQNEAQVLIPIHWVIQDLAPYLFYDIEDEDQMRFEVDRPGLYHMDATMNPPEGFVLTEKPEDFEIEGGPLHMSLRTSEGTPMRARFTLRIEAGAWDPESFQHVALETWEHIDDLPLFTWQHESTQLAAAGKQREAIDLLRAQVIEDPSSIPARLRLGDMFEVLGMLEPARALIGSAFALRPDDPALQHQLVYILMHGYFGNELVGDIPREELRALVDRVATRENLDPQSQALLAINTEQDTYGYHHTDREELDKAHRFYEAMGDSIVAEGYGNNLLINRFVAGDYDTVRRRLEIGEANFAKGMELAITMLSRGKLAYARKTRDIATPLQRTIAVAHASDLLARGRKYPESKEALESLTELADNPRMKARFEVLDRARPIDLDALPADDPISPVKKAVAYYLSDQTRSMIDTCTVDTDSLDRLGRLPSIGKIAFPMRKQAFMAGITLPHHRDIVLALLDFSSREVENGVHLVTMSMHRNPDFLEETFFVVETEEGYKILTAIWEIEAVAESVHAAYARDEPEWARLLVATYLKRNPSGMMDLGLNIMGDLFGLDSDKPDDRAIQVMTTPPGLHSRKDMSYVKKLIAGAEDEETRQLLRMLRAESLFYAGKQDKAIGIWQELIEASAEEKEERNRVREHLAQKLAEAGRFAEAKQQLELLIEDRGDQFNMIHRDRVDLAVRSGDLAGARTIIEEHREARLSSLNLRAAWLSLFEGEGLTREIELLEEKEESTASGLAIAFQTVGNDVLACLYARVGRIDEAIARLEQRAENDNRPEPDDKDWLVYGIIAEELGFPGYARAYYQRVAKPSSFEEADPLSSYPLAQKYLAALDQSKEQPDLFPPFTP